MSSNEISEARPWVSRKIGVPPRQAAQYNAALIHRGITNCFFDPQTGDAVAHSHAGRNALLKFRGALDLEGGYGDWCGV